MITLQLPNTIDGLSSQLDAYLVDVEDHTCGYFTYSLPKSMGQGSVDYQVFATGSYHLHIDAQFLESVELHFDAPSVSRPHSLSVLEGAAVLDISEGSYGTEVTLHSSTLFRPANDGDFSVHFKGGQRIRASIIHFGEALVDELVEPYCQTDISFLMPSKEVPRNQTHSLGPVASFAVSKLIEDSFRSRLMGVARKAYRYGKTLQVVAIQLDLAERLSRGESFAKPLRADDIAMLESARHYLTSHYPEDITLADVADHVGTNQQKLKRLFKTFFGASVSKSLRKIRVENGRNLLRTGRFSVGEASNAVGYANQSHFAVRFKEEYGISPKAFIKAESFDSKA